MTPNFNTAGNRHTALIAPYAEVLHDLTRRIQNHPHVQDRMHEIMASAADNPNRHHSSALTSLSHVLQLQGNELCYNGHELSQTEERLACLMLKSAFLQDILEVIPARELSRKVIIHDDLYDKDVVEAFEQLQLTGLACLIKGAMAERSGARAGTVSYSFNYPNSGSNVSPAATRPVAAVQPAAITERVPVLA